MKYNKIRSEASEVCRIFWKTVDQNMTKINQKKQQIVYENRTEIKGNFWTYPLQIKVSEA